MIPESWAVPARDLVKAFGGACGKLRCDVRLTLANKMGYDACPGAKCVAVAYTFFVFQTSGQSVLRDPPNGTFENYCTVTATFVVCVVRAATRSGHAHGVATQRWPRFILLLPPPPAQLLRVTPKKTSTVNPSNAVQRLLWLGTPSRKMQTMAIPLVAAK